VTVNNPSKTGVAFRRIPDPLSALCQKRSVPPLRFKKGFEVDQTETENGRFAANR
jgi:hypothetical protein